MTERAVNEMSAEQVRYEIAERRGWHDFSTDTGVLTGWQGDYYLPVPDWPHNVEAALALCLDAQKRIEEQDGDPWLLMYDGEAWSLGFFVRGGVHQEYTASADTPALALSRLALEVLRYMGASDD